MADQSKAFPLSFAQQRLWLLDQLVPGSPLYNLGGGLLLRGPLQIPALVAAFRVIGERHESLRTIFGEDGGRPVQRILPAGAVPLPVIDLSALPPAARQREAARRVDEEAHRPFDLRTGPLFRVTLLHLGPQHHQLTIALHHIVSDGWSMGILNRELTSLYGAFARRSRPELPELPIQYVDFAVWQRESLGPEALEGQLEHWRNRLRGMRPLLALPTDRPRPAVQSFRGALQRFELGEEITAGLKLLSQRLGVTLFSLMIAALKVLLHRYSNEPDLAVGTVVAGRNRMEIENLIGFFVNPLVLRTDVGGNPSFAELAGRVSAVLQEALAHQDLPFDKLVEELSPERTLSHAPLFQVVASQNTPGEPIDLADVHIEGAPLASRTAKFDLAYVVEDRNRTLAISLEYSTDLFDGATVQRMGRHLQTIFEGAVAHPDQGIAALPLLQAGERHQTLVEWNDSRHELPRDRRPHELFEEHARRNPDAVAVISNQGRWSYGWLDREANRLASYLRSQGVGPDVPVAMYLERGIELMIALLGIFKAGGAYVGLDLLSPPDRLAWVIEDSGAPMVLTTKAQASHLPQTAARLICLDQEEWRQAPPERPPILTDFDHLHSIIYTSGSTGRPKGTGVVIRNHVNLLQWFAEVSRFGPRTRVLLPTGLNWDASFRSAFSALIAGGATVLADNGPFDPRKVLAVIADHQVTVTNTPISLMHPVIEAAREGGFRDLESIEHLYLGGEQLVTARVRDWQESPACRAQVRNVYGLTETSDVSTLEIVGLETLRRMEAAPVGRPVGNHRLYVLSAMGEPQPIGVPGEIAIASEEGLTRGYLKRPELTADRFRPDPWGVGERIYRTGDLGRFLPDGRLEYRGRVDYQVKIRGMRVEIEEIEEQIRQYPQIAQAVVELKNRGSEDRQMVGYLMPRPGREIKLEELTGFLRDRLPDFMVPQAFVVVHQMPLNASGKVDRRALPEPDWGRSRAVRDYVAPSTPEEEAVARIFCQLFGVEKVGTDDHFFALGGHSLLALQLLSRIRDTLKVEVPLQHLFQSPTVGELAQAIVELSRAGAAPAQAGGSIQRVTRREDPLETVVVGLQPDGEGNPIFCVHPVTGSVLGYQALARALGEAQPFYGVQSPDPEALGAPFAGIEAMAAAYLQVIQKLELDRPVVLAGWSMGGLVAFEMARQAKAASTPPVALVALLDPTPPGLFEEAASEALSLSLFANSLGREAGKHFELPLEDLEALEPAEQWDYFLLKARIRKLFPLGVTEQLAPLYRSFKMNLHAVRGYTPEPYDGAVAIVVPQESVQDPSSIWRRIVQGRLDIHEAPGDHQSFLQAPHVETWAHRLSESIAAAELSNLTALQMPRPEVTEPQRH